MALDLSKEKNKKMNLSKNQILEFINKTPEMDREPLAMLAKKELEVDGILSDYTLNKLLDKIYYVEPIYKEKRISLFKLIFKRIGGRLWFWI